MVTTHTVRYEGPSSLAVQVATLLADADGIDLTSAEKQEPAGGSGDTVLLTLTVEATTGDVAAAVGSISGGLPDGARITVDRPTGGP